MPERRRRSTLPTPYTGPVCLTTDWEEGCGDLEAWAKSTSASSGIFWDAVLRSACVSFSRVGWLSVLDESLAREVSRGWDELTGLLITN